MSRKPGPAGSSARRACAVVASLCSLAGGVAACGTNGGGQKAQAGGPILVTVDPAHPGATLPTDFLGLSFEASVLGSTLFDPVRSDLSILLRALGTGRLRFGGNSLDRVTAWTAEAATPLPGWASSRVSPADLERLAGLATATGWKVDLGVTVGHPDAGAAANEALAAVRLLGEGLGTIQIGNEPDLLGDVRPAYSEAGYRADVAAYRASIAAVAPDVQVSGPDTAVAARLASYGSDDGAGLAFFTQHFYPLTRCAGRRPTIDQLLSVSTLEAEKRVASTAVVASHAAGLPVRLDETNSASCGGQDGVSNTLGSALWIIEYLATVAQRGVDGVGIQGGLAACRGYTPICVPGAKGAARGTAPGIDAVADSSLGAARSADGRLAAQPDFYGLLVIHELEGGQWLPCTGTPPGRAWEAAVKMPDGAVRVVIVNPSPSTATDISLDVPGHGGPASVQWLTGPSLGATAAVRLGGAEVGADGAWRPFADAPLDSGGTGVRVTVPAATAALVTLPASPSGP
ncbi:MAG: glycosyl hydrolase family 79 C-terminal domain-containing protein [Actinomycetota bacterium]|nr:glycosyl hydrolase family 79 C-terminal domain-containing protein [Actinomycetota bacterium]